MIAQLILKYGPFKLAAKANTHSMKALLAAKLEAEASK